MTKKYEILLVADICIINADQMIEWHDQGWEYYETNTYHSLMVAVSKHIIVETNRIEQYINAINALCNGIRVEWWEEIKSDNN